MTRLEQMRAAIANKATGVLPVKPEPPIPEAGHATQPKKKPIKDANAPKMPSGPCIQCVGFGRVGDFWSARFR